jgi:ABC-2 type transport system permease protein
MRNTLAIAGKETRIYFTTWTSYVLIGAFVLITAYFFQALVRQFQLMSAQAMQMQAAWAQEQLNLTDMVVTPLILNMTVFFLFFLPIVTMRLVAEERKGKTLELLLTSPVRPLEIVLGKYLAALLLMSVMLGTTLLFPALLHLFGESNGGSVLDWHSTLTGYLGLFLLGAAFLSVGLFTSAVTESQVVAVVLGFFVLLMFFVLGYAAQGQEGAGKAIFEYLGLSNHIEGFARGIIRTPAVVYYTSLVFVGLFLTFRVIEAQRWR